MHHKLLDMVSSPFPFLRQNTDYKLPGGLCKTVYLWIDLRCPTKSLVLSSLGISSRVQLRFHQITGTALSARSFPPLLLGTAQAQMELGNLLTSDSSVGEKQNVKKTPATSDNHWHRLSQIRITLITIHRKHLWVLSFTLEKTKYCQICSFNNIICLNILFKNVYKCKHSKLQWLLFKYCEK